MESIGIGIIGSGGIARGAHLPGYRALGDGVRIVAVADVSEETARRAADEFGVPHCYKNYRDLLARDDIDAVSICTPNYLHHRPTIDALESGIAPPVSTADVRPTMELVAAIYASAFERRPVRRGEIGPGSPFYQSNQGTGAPWA